MARTVWLLLARIATALALKTQLSLPLVDEELAITRLQISRKTGPFTPLKKTSNVLNLRRENALSLSSVYVQSLRRKGATSRASNASVNLISAEVGQVFLAPVTIGTQNFDMVVDSGSSDPWVVGQNFQCADVYDGTLLGQADCEFGPRYDPTESSTTYSSISNQNFNISYADGEILNGDMGYEKFTMGDIVVPQQKFGLVDYAAWKGDGVSSGLVGFAYSTLTSAYAGIDPSTDVRGNTLIYNTLFTNMWKNQGVSPVFTLALYRDLGNGGVLALGGVPDIPYSPGFASTPIIPVGVNRTDGSIVYEFYTITIDGYAVVKNGSTQFAPAGSENARKKNLLKNGTQTIVDSGTSIFYCDDDVAEAVNLLFDPPGYQDPDTGAWMVPCDSMAPVFGVGVSGKIFYVNPVDMVLQVSPTDCMSGIQGRGEGLSILGDVWMKSVLCVFDIGAGMMRFAAREYYGLTSTFKSPNT